MKFKFISCNARVQTTGDGEQQFLNRVDFLCKTLLSLDADIIGFQEVTPLMKVMIAERMPAYAFVGGGRGADRLGESPLIAVKQSKFFIERIDTQNLSPTPIVPGSRYEDSDQSLCPRAFASADICSLENGTVMRFMNVHTDHIGERARYLEVEQMLKYYAEVNSLRPMPTVITGDFNAEPSAPEIMLMTESGAFTDVTEKLAPTFHGYEKMPETKIDYIFATRELRADKVYAIRDKDGALYLSDHDPVIAEMEL